MSNPFGDQRTKYDYTVPAEALLVNFNNHKGLRVEAPTIGLEFSDGQYLGGDPEGILSYKSLDDFQIGQAGSKYQISTIPYKEGVCLHISFYHRDPNRPFAEFLAEDTTNTVSRNSMESFGSSGSWNKLVLGSATATVTKISDESDITLTVDTIRKKATWNTDGSPIADLPVTAHGTLYFKDLNSINGGVSVNYNSDRLVFHVNWLTSKDFTAYFIPFDASGANIKGLNNPTDYEFKNVVTWSEA